MPIPQPTLDLLAAHAEAADTDPAWPDPAWTALRAAGVLALALPRDHGGAEAPARDLLATNASLAGACLTSAFILSQRDAAVRRLLDAARDPAHEPLARQLLPPLARGDTFATVGLSQLTTSRQHAAPALTARLTPDALHLDGILPWVTGAARADHVVLGAVLDDGRQVLAVLPRGLPGVTVGPPLPLCSLTGSLTAEVALSGVRLDRRWLLAGPAERVMASATRGGAGGLETSCLALGLAAAAVDYLRTEVRARPDLGETATRLASARAALWVNLTTHAEGPGASPDATARLRARANTLVLRATQAALAAAKGAGFVRGHPAQRWARQALFFLVWSCPRPAVDATLAALAAPDGLGPCS